ncbi:MAG: restriction endonuclease subunit S [Oscillospiraceae bacterium]|nr:restriction endonuclease subunit S [Oscillospiraceae bacterium]
MNRKPLPREENIYETKCPILYAMELIGQKWKLPILWYIADAQNQTLRYRELERKVVGITATIAHCGDLLLTCKGTVGKTSILAEKEVHIARQIMAITAILVDTVFIQRFIECQVDNLKSKAKSMIPGIERDNVLKLAFPLPPLAEQKRIVARLEELLPLCERLK